MKLPMNAKMKTVDLKVDISGADQSVDSSGRTILHVGGDAVLSHDLLVSPGWGWGKDDVNAVMSGDSIHMPDGSDLVSVVDELRRLVNPGPVVVKCKWCGQWGARRCACKHCGQAMPE